MELKKKIRASSVPLKMCVVQFRGVDKKYDQL